MNSGEWVMVIGMALVTFAIRYPVLGFADRIKLAPSMRQAMRYIPPAVLAAIILPAVLAPRGVLAVNFTNAFLVAGIAALVIAWISKNLLLTIVVGMAVLWLHIWLF